MPTIRFFQRQIVSLYQWILRRLECENGEEPPTYQKWQENFLKKRLSLAFPMATLVIVSFIILNIFGYFTTHLPESTSWIISYIFVQILLLIGFYLLETKWGKNHLNLIFIWYSFSLSLPPLIKQTILGHVDIDLFTWIITFFSQATLIPVRLHLHFITQLGVFAYYFGVNCYLGLNIMSPPPFAPTIDFSPFFFMIGINQIFWICSICNLSILLYDRLAQREFKARQKLKLEQSRSEQLLLNILPKAIAEQLKNESNTIAEASENVTVLFADIVGFTTLATTIPPKELVDLLNQIFSIFDELAEIHQVEKIKTIGDAYMVVAGLPEHRVDHAHAIANIALDMQDAITNFNKKTGYNLNIRIGIDTGPVVAGVIGLKKFAYDLWGDTVNTASRMESHGIAGSIQVTDNTYQHLHNRYLLEKRGNIFIKGKGEMTTYLLKEKRPILLPFTTTWEK